MQINITYEPTAKELVKASSLFIEKKPFMFYSIGFINIFAWFILAILILKLLVEKTLTPNEGLASVTACVWLFARRPVSEAILNAKMKGSFILNNPLTIDISLNGLAWHGKRIRSESIKWTDITFAFEAKNGFIIPNAFSRFLWLPFRGFQSADEINAFRQMLVDRNIDIKIFPKWEC
jgi:hypothetical protein